MVPEVNEVSDKVGNNGGGEPKNREDSRASNSLSDVCIDYVIVFSLKPLDGKVMKDKSAHEAGLKTEYLALMDRLRNAGLSAISRPGNDSTEELLILISALDESLIQKEVEAERLTDWLHGITSVKPEPGIENQVYTPAERLRHIYNIITQETSNQSTQIESPISAHPHRRSISTGAGIIPGHDPFLHVKLIFPPHDIKFNRTWISNWNDRSHLSIRIPEPELDQIKDIYGDSIGYYFAFLDFYFQALIFPASLGLVYWLIGVEFSSAYSIILLTWSVGFIETWKVKERLLSIKWSSFSCHKVEKSRVQFKPERMIVHSVTNEMVGYFPWWKRQYRMLFTFPLLLFFAIGIIALIIAITALEVVTAEVYNGPFKQALALFPTVLFAAAVPQLVGLWQSIAIKLASWENHSYQSTYDRSLTLKIFTVHGLVAYSGLLLTAFAYVPFGSLLVPHLASLTHKFIKQKSVPLEGSPDLYMNTETLDLSTYTINHDRLYQQLFAYMVTNQVVNSFTEVGLPYVLKIVSFKWNKILIERQKQQAANSDKKSLKKGSASQSFFDLEDEKDLLERLREESKLPEYHLFVEYAEMAIQFGYVVLWTVIWPISPLFSFVNNFFELRTDAIKLTKQSRRPVPIRSDSIGPWIDVLSTLSWLGAIINSSLICLFKPSQKSSIDLKLFSENSTLSPSVLQLNSKNSNESLKDQPTRIIANLFVSAIKDRRGDEDQRNDRLNSILLSVLLPVFFSENAFLLLRFVVREIINRLMWNNSEAKIKQLKAEYELKQNFITNNLKKEENMDRDDDNQERNFLAERSKIKRNIDRNSFREVDEDILNRVDNHRRKFWDRDDVGIEIIERLAKTV
ncbi:calcium-activated chloride channel-domain-containing protein [Phakopsora pachyrhizi]|uniref:Calcium-activated chloride channel-domain-containing protein n=1 Tax=Phakopsora pachyrhizi TaxID=170000 RepID=A0AAV0BNL7_PHAPC|nr:calcium-activated chloride channel-domain-containing protein [Phakopsora pachyrhizi]CAH7688249.1 calcium-activated chloride channel-domain-containing protein [Phakopsora pachyrhizi]